MTQSFKAMKAFLKHYSESVCLRKDLDPEMADWWKKNKKDYLRSTFEDFQHSVHATLLYNQDNPNRK